MFWTMDMMVFMINDFSVPPHPIIVAHSGLYFVLLFKYFPIVSFDASTTACCCWIGHRVNIKIHFFVWVFEVEGSCKSWYCCSIVLKIVWYILFHQWLYFDPLWNHWLTSPFCPMSTVISLMLMRSLLSLLSVKWLLCIQSVNLPNVSLSRFSSLISVWLTPCFTSISIFSDGHISMQCGIEK